jgi:hypothetical protein
MLKGGGGVYQTRTISYANLDSTWINGSEYVTVLTLNHIKSLHNKIKSVLKGNTGLLQINVHR